MRKVMVLGCGLVGSVITRELASSGSLEVIAVDVDGDALKRLSARVAAGQGEARLKTIRADLRDSVQVRSIIREADVVVGAVPGWLGYDVLESIIAERKSFVDISFMPEDPRPLQQLASAAGIVGFVDFGVAPGMSNILATRAAAQLDEADDVRIYVGGLPKVRRQPYEYAAVFSPADVIEEYTREARLVVGGRVVTRTALTDPEFLEFERVGTLEAFNTDGLRSLMWTLNVPNMKEKTMRYPGHADRMRLLRDTGLLSKRSVRIGEVDVRPLDLTLKLLQELWRLPEGEEDITVMRIEARGTKNGHPAVESYDLFDSYDAQTRTTSMARTTGFPCAIAASMLAEGLEDFAPGLYFPEAWASKPALLERLLQQLAARGVVFQYRHRSDAHQVS